MGGIPQSRVSDPSHPPGDGHTQLSEDDRIGLIPTHIATLRDLYQAEQANIAVALLRPAPSSDDLLTDHFLRGLHEAMFREVWVWAGKYRVRETNIGISFELIAGEVRKLVGDAAAWVRFGTYEADEIAMRFHHRLVAIHAFPNGNGRHARIAADYLVRALGNEPFSWGRSTYAETDKLRAAYLDALRSADAGNIENLLAFGRS